MIIVKRKKAFTLVELLVVIAIIALLLSILMPSLGKARQLARAVVCLSNTKQWGTIFAMYTMDYKDYFPPGIDLTSVPASGKGFWMYAARSYYSNPRICSCPTDTKQPVAAGADNTFRGWGPFPPIGWAVDVGNIRGSYGINLHVDSLDEKNPMVGSMPVKGYIWGKVTGISSQFHLNTIPVIADSLFFEGWFGDHVPPNKRGSIDCSGELPGTWRFCVDRHNGKTEVLFMDWSARPVYLKELWTLQWHRKFNTANRWTKAGGATPDLWEKYAPWMAGMKDF
jgi:prepilin-type N-terminal cleavage/methylation domain-containing protein